MKLKAACAALVFALVSLAVSAKPPRRPPPLRPFTKDAFCVSSPPGYVCCYSCGFGNQCCAYYSCDAMQGPCLDYQG